MAETYEPYATREDMQALRSDLIDRIGAVETRLIDRISRLEGLMTLMVRLTLITTAAVVAGATKIIFFSG